MILPRAHKMTPNSALLQSVALSPSSKQVAPSFLLITILLLFCLFQESFITSRGQRLLVRSPPQVYGPYHPSIVAG